MNLKIKEHLKNIYSNLYSENEINKAFSKIEKLIFDAKDRKIIKEIKRQNQSDVYMITYGDSFNEKNINPLTTLKKVKDDLLNDVITEIHILPHFPFSSDDGFSVIDYEKVNPDFGTWEDIKALSKSSNLMFDYVINHMSKKSQWFKKFLEGDEYYSDFFIKKNNKWDYTKVVRPRTSPLFHDYEKSNGEIETVWTTFSEDQVDLNFKSLNLLIESIRILIKYMEYGMSSIRLDAVGFLWKEDSSTCIHLENTHNIIKLWRLIMEEFSDNFRIITETNVPFEENISYFGNNDEAHLVYQFPLPPLTLHTFIKQDSTKILDWAKSLDFLNENKKISFFNFIASHDGIGMRSVEGILNDQEVNDLKLNTLEKGGQISNRTVGSIEKVYELNINFFSALKENDKYDVERFIASQGILLSMVGVPAIYYHSMFGSENYEYGYKETGIKRRINREKINYNNLLNELSDQTTNRNKIFNSIKDLIEIRKQEIAFDPYADQEVVFLSKKVFSILRKNGDSKILVLINISNEEIELEDEKINGIDLISRNKYSKKITLKPYQVSWIK